MIKKNPKNVIREFVFGMEDGIVSNLGLVLGVYVGGGSSFTILLAGVASMVAGAFSMSAGSYLSAKSQREVYEHEIQQAEEKLKKQPKKYLKEMKTLLQNEGFDADEVKALLHHFEHHNHSTFVTNYIQKKVGISEHKLDHPVRNAMTMFLSFFVGSLFPVIPFFFATASSAAITAIILATLALFGVGIAKTYYTKLNWFKSGFEIMLVGLGAAVIGYIVGRVIGLLG